MNESEYLAASEVIDWHHPEIIELAQQIASGCQTSTAIAQACFVCINIVSLLTEGANAIDG